MIMVNLKGGLGNQMFQYACARAIVLRHAQKGTSVDLKVDTFYFPPQSLRKYALGVFNIQAEIARDAERKKIKYPFGIVSKAWRFFAGKFLKRYNTVQFKKRFLAFGDNTFLDGYFQSEQYFADVRDEILKDFSLKDPLAGDAAALEEQITHDPNAVSLHVRRTDYVGHSELEMKDYSYYDRAIAAIREHVAMPHVYVFSDDIEWVKQSLQLPEGTTYVSRTGMKDYEELVLMSKCKHNIIANSSFSWWGAWLNTNPQKCVVAPKQWSNKEERNMTAFSDIVPDTWTRL